MLGYKGSNISKLFGVSDSTIPDIKTGKRRSNIKLNERLGGNNGEYL